MCVMPVETEHDDLVHMQHVLIEAHCREHRITLVKVSMILPTNTNKSNHREFQFHKKKYY